MKYFSSNYQNAYDHQAFQGGDMLRPALAHIYVWHLIVMVLWGHVTNKIYISICRRCMDTTQNKVLT